MSFRGACTIWTLARRRRWIETWSGETASFVPDSVMPRVPGLTAALERERAWKARLPCDLTLGYFFSRQYR